MQPWVNVGINVGTTLISLLVGGVITCYVAKHYYERASRDLRVEAEELRKLNDLILKNLEHAGLVKLSRDAQGNVTGFQITLSVHDAVHFEEVAKVKIGENEPPEK